MKKLFACLVTILVTTGVMAETKPFNLSLTPDIAVYNRSTTIEGITLSVWGENPQTALSLGFVNGSTGTSIGLSWGVFFNYADNYKGVQWALINYAKQDSLGWNAGFINYTEGFMMGLLTGVVNYANRLKGVQFGLVNYVEETDTGFQIGLVNIIKHNRSWFGNMPDEFAPVMILVNW
ncbi:MAG: hypothetical protein A2020_10135 [Lentisphaerae bacterium GWF2_45_14]|nr:MAG: hypothetical protein A2020_10135 [Lentisphaerae bacterium GWF2_45_14]